LHRGRLRGEILSFTLADIQQELIKVMRDVAAEESGDVLVALGHAAVGPVGLGYRILVLTCRSAVTGSIMLRGDTR
jgi:hypothetical protein